MIRSILKRVYRLFLNYGIDVIKFKNSSVRIGWFYRDLKQLKKQKGVDNTFDFGERYPILTDRYKEGGVMKGHYFHQDLYVARLIYAAKPEKHIDVGSRTDGFVAHVASFREIEILDIRDIKSNVKNISFRKADMMKLPEDLINYCDSISSLHTIEHFGLGRYNDPVDYFGYLKGIMNIKKILKPGGTFYFSVPIGPQRIEFNAHRIFSIKYLLEILSESFSIYSFSFVDDSGDFHENIELSVENVNTNLGCNHGCGIFTLIKK
mgnify:CR=1 FL=1